MQESLQRLRCWPLKCQCARKRKPLCPKPRRLSHMYRPAMQDRIEGHLPFCASILPADAPAKDPAVSSPLGCEAARTLLEPVLSAAGPGRADVTGSQSQGPACVKAAAR